MARQRRLLRPPGVLVRWFESQPSLMRRCGALLSRCRAITRRGAPQRAPRAQPFCHSHTRVALARYKEMGDEPLEEHGDE